jgi:hypothetical protein
VDPEVSLCAHLASLEPGAAAFTLAPGESVGWYDGPVEAIARCASCGAAAWLELLDWSGDRAVRVFAMAGLRARDAAVYLANAKKGSCDPKRERAELEALVACAGPFERLVAWRVRDERLLAVAPLPPETAIPSGAWSERLAAPGDASWFARLGLDKAVRV